MGGMSNLIETRGCWVVTEGMAGTENQCLGVAAALGVEPVVKKIKLAPPWNLFSPYLGFEIAGSFIPPLLPPWPDLLLASGRKGIAAARYIKKKSGKRTFTVFIQDPRIDPAQFDLVAVPAHDPTRGENVIVTDAAPNRITPETLDAARRQFQKFATLHRPRIAVLIGGDSKAHRLTRPVLEKLVTQLQGLNAGLMVTVSRRTGKAHEDFLRGALAGPYCHFWDGSGANPYLGMLGWADAILVTNDSVSMLSDAASTGKPVYAIALQGGGQRLDLLQKNLIDKGILRVFEGKIERWDYPPLQDSARIGAEIRRRMPSGLSGRIGLYQSSGQEGTHS